MAEIIGTAGDETLNGGAGDDIIHGLGGRDRILAAGGNDIVYGGDGNDYIYGGTGDDTLYGGLGRDVVVGEAGNDILYGNEDDDALYGGGNEDILYGGAGDDRLYGDGGNDVLYGGEGNDSGNGGSGNDTFYGGSGINEFNGMSGVDTVVIELTSAGITPAVLSDLAALKTYMDEQLAAANGSIDTLAARSSGPIVSFPALGLSISVIEAVITMLDGVVVPIDDFFNKPPVTDPVASLETSEDVPVEGAVVATDAATDTLTYSVSSGPANGTLTLNSATGAYTYAPNANYSGADTFTVTVTDQAGASSQQTVQVAVSAVADAPVLTVLNSTVVVAGQTLNGGKQADRLTGGAGADTINGGSGNDVIFGSGPSSFTVPLDISAALTDLDGSEALSSIIIGNVPQGGTLSAGIDNGDGTWTLSASDLSGLTLSATVASGFTLSVSATSMEQAGGSATTSAQIEVQLTSDNNLLSGGNGNDTITGGAGNDTISGGKGDDRIDGGSGNDVLNGNTGNDVISDGAGDDRSYGGKGNDTLIAGEGNDFYDGGSGFDTLDFSAASAAMTIDVSKKTASGMGSDTFAGIEAIIGSNFADNYKGSSGADVFYGGDGDDVIRGLGGADRLSGGQGNDTFVWLKKDVTDGTVHYGVDTITDYQVGDTLDLHDFLKSAKYTSIDQVLRISDGPSGSTVSVKVGSAFVDVVTLENVFGLDAQSLVDSGGILI